LRLSSFTPAPAQTIIDEWSSVKAPPAATLQPVTVNPKTTALLMIDLIKQTCNEQRRPRCVASISKIEKLLGAARASGVTVIYTLFPSPAPDKFPNPVIGDILPAVAPKGDWGQSGNISDVTECPLMTQNGHPRSPPANA
jgi:hypothetical protein